MSHLVLRDCATTVKVFEQPGEYDVCYSFDNGGTRTLVYPREEIAEVFDIVESLKKCGFSVIKEESTL
jgi:hypothetical protein